MAHWLYKTEPHSWSWEQQMEAGAAGTFWSGVRNYMARGFLQKMQVGDRGFFYHSGEEKRIVGIVEVIKPYYPDHTDSTGKFGMVDVKAVGPVPKPVTLAEIKAEPRLKDMILVNNSRLSVQPVTDEEWRLICEMSGAKS
jgi:predicted RNA-binding protein with PUA-like domain